MTNLPATTIEWIAHRGCPTLWPENSIEGFRAALEAGVGFIECDVQLSADKTPLLFHDVDLNRMTGRNSAVFSRSASELKELALSPPKDSHTQRPVNLSTLSELATLLAEFPQATAFIELKTESIKHFGLEQYLSALWPVLGQFSTPVVIISFSSSVLAAVSSQSNYPIGWVIPRWNTDQHQKAKTLKPDWLFCNIERLPDDHTALWSGHWRWGLYTINNIETARAYQQRGFAYLETNCILDLINERC